MLGIYTCYNEKAFGSIKKAAEVSSEFLIWDLPVPVKRHLKYPTKIIIRVKGGKIFYQGDLLLVMQCNELDAHIFTEPNKHRPLNWVKTQPYNKSVLFISNLQEVDEPEEIKGRAAPQGIIYVNIIS